MVVSSFRTVSVDIYRFGKKQRTTFTAGFRTVSVDIYQSNKNHHQSPTKGFRTVSVDIYLREFDELFSQLPKFSYSIC